MFQIPQQFSSAGKAQLDAQLQLLHKFQRRVFDHTEQLLALHANSGKAALDKASQATRQLLAAKNTQDFFTVAAAQVAPALEHVSGYGKQLFNIASGKPPTLMAPVTPLLTLAPAQPAAMPQTQPQPGTVNGTQPATAAPAAQLMEAAPSAVDKAVAADVDDPVEAPVAAAAAAPVEAAVAPDVAVAVAAAPVPASVPAPVPAAVVSAKAAAAKPASVKPAAAATEPKARDTMAVKTTPKPKK